MQLHIQTGDGGKQVEIPQISLDFHACVLAASQVCVQKTAVKHTQFSRLPLEGMAWVGREITQIVKSRNGQLAKLASISQICDSTINRPARRYDLGNPPQLTQNGVIAAH